MEITLLGTACAVGGMDRDNTYFLIQNREDCTMVDVGGSPLSKLAKLGISVHQVKEIIFTHFHIDHVYGLPSLLWGMWLAGRTKPLIIYCSSENEVQLKKWLEVIDIHQWPVLFEVQIHKYAWRTESLLIKEEELMITTFPSLHLGPTVGLKIQYKDKVLVYSADTEPNSWIKEQKQIDIMIHEATTAERPRVNHTSLQEIINYYPLERIDQVVAVHLTDTEPYDRVLDSQVIAIKDKIIIGFDFMKINL
ncbi:MBL fold metallo-hydrolase [Paenibacillus sp. Root444D2]|uniref:MBL fold metallo-hydrolase n=1 Tax=Paenibacillus sp. Root444D2 TaxID=1736538 RepID=UPI00070BE0AD|nr:ribonuclease Z [Paenibacillus sp. Root444D2]KQX51812.1 MBL fold metallo-hydrolase [Paenibacillus sp. Root444D2]